MSARNLLWIVVPVALSAGVLWLSAQDSNQPEGVKIGELAEKVQARERAASQKESALVQLEQRLNTLQATLDQEREQVKAREKALEEEKDKFEQEQVREREKVRTQAQEQAQAQAQAQAQQEQAREQQKAREQEQLRKQNETLRVNDQLVRMYEAMDPATASEALEELAKTNLDTAVALMASVAPKKAAKIFDQLTKSDTRLVGVLSQRIGRRNNEEPAR